MDPNTRFRSLITKSRNGRSGAQQSARSAHVVMRPCCTSVNHAPRRVRFLLSLGFGPPRLFRSSRNTLSATEPCRWRSTWCAPSKSSSGGGRTPRLIPPESDPLGPAPGSASDTRPGGETQLRHDEHPLFPQASRCPPKRSNSNSPNLSQICTDLAGLLVPQGIFPQSAVITDTPLLRKFPRETNILRDIGTNL